jgi:hypothetical protein
VIKNKKKSFKKYYDDFDDEELSIKESYKRTKIRKEDIPLIIEDEIDDENSN